MVNLFIAYSGKDTSYVVDTVIPALLSDNNSINVLILGSKQHANRYAKLSDELAKDGNFYVEMTGNNWKRTARRSINKADAVLVIAGSDIADKKDTIGYEVNHARKLGKLVFINKKEESILLPDFLKEIDQFTKRIRNISEPQSLDEIKKRLCDYDRGFYNIFNGSESKENTEHNNINLIMDQYKMYQRTSEDLVARRQNVSSFYLTVNGTIVTLTGLILGLCGFPQNLLILFFLGVFGIVLDISWINLLDAYGSLNSAKMKVISLMEKQLPINVYDVEWKVMSDKLNRKKYLSFTESEKRIPIIFIFIYLLIIAVVFVIIIIAWTKGTISIDAIADIFR